MNTNMDLKQVSKSLQKYKQKAVSLTIGNLRYNTLIIENGRLYAREAKPNYASFLLNLEEVIGVSVAFITGNETKGSVIGLNSNTLLPFIHSADSTPFYRYTSAFRLMGTTKADKYGGFLAIPIYKLDNGLLNMLYLDMHNSYSSSGTVYCFSVPCAVYKTYFPQVEYTLYGQPIEEGIEVKQKQTDFDDTQFMKSLTLFDSDDELYGPNETVVDNYGNLIKIVYTQKTVGYFDFAEVKCVTVIETERRFNGRSSDTLLIDAIITNLRELSKESWINLLSLGSNAISLLNLKSIPYIYDVLPKLNGALILTESQLEQEIGTQAISLMLRSGPGLLILPNNDYTAYDLLNPEYNTVIHSFIDRTAEDRESTDYEIKLVSHYYSNNYSEMSRLIKSATFFIGDVAKELNIDLKQKTNYKDNYKPTKGLLSIIFNERGQSYIKKLILELVRG